MSTEVLGWSVKTKLCSACRYFFSPSILNIIESHPMQGLGVGFGEVRTKAHIKKAGEGMWIPAFKVCENIPRVVMLLCMFLERNGSLDLKLENLSMDFWVLQWGKKSFLGLWWCVCVRYSDLAKADDVWSPSTYLVRYWEGKVAFTASSFTVGKVFLVQKSHE